MITVTNRDFEILTQINYDGDKGLVVIDDEFSQPESSDLSTYTFSFLNTEDGAELVAVGCYVFAQDGDDIRAFEILETQDENNIRTVFCFDGGLDLINEEKSPWNWETSEPISVYVNECIFDSGWEIGINEIPTTRKRKLKYESAESSVKRLRKIANSFDAEIEYRFVIDENTLVRRVIDIYQKGSRSKTIVLEYGNEVSGITKTENIQNLATGLYAVGEGGVNLEGYIVPSEDSANYSIYGGTLVDKTATKKWGRWKHELNGYILAHYESTAKTQKTLYQETKEQLRKRSVPEVTYEVDISYFPEKLRRSYNVAIIAHEFKPAITIEATVTSIDGVSFAKCNHGVAKVSNVHTIDKPPLELEIETLKNRFNNQVSNWNNAPYQLEISSLNGTIFQNNNISTTLTAKITKNDIDVTNTMTRIVWKRVSRYNTTGDADFNREGVSISITKDDVDAETRFICKAYINNDLIAQADIVIKDFVMTAHRGETAPENPDTGTLWVDTTNDQEITKIYDNGKWSAVVNDITADDLQNGLETYLAPIREKQQLLEAELQAKATKDLSDKLLAEFQAFVQQINDNRKFDSEQLLSLLQRLALQETNFGKFKNQWNFLDGFITFSDEGMYIGSKESSTSILVANGGITIFSNGSEVASFKEGYMKIDNGIFTRSVQIGTKWRIQPYRLNDDVLAFIYLGGVIEVV